MKKFLAFLLGASLVVLVWAGTTEDSFNIGGNLSVTGTTALTGAVTLTGNIQAADITATGDVTVTDDLEIGNNINTLDSIISALVMKSKIGRAHV